jgi:Family of unknown function (DUF5681)
MMLHLQRGFADNRQDQAMAGRGGKRSTSFKPGQSGNPHGRPKVAGEVQELLARPSKQDTKAVTVWERLLAA